MPGSERVRSGRYADAQRLADRSKLRGLTASHELKHNVCRAEVGGCISRHTYISRSHQMFTVRLVMTATPS